VAANMRVRRERRNGGEARAPLVVIDERGGEVGVLVDYTQYVTLLRLVSSTFDRGTLPRYWRGALDDCLALSD